jgi:Tfp pilus assembly protein PilV
MPINQQGQSLIEALIALGVAGIIVAAITIAVISAVSNSDFAKYQNLATNAAQEEMAYVRNLSKTDWNGFQATYSDGNLSGCFCYDHLNKKLTSTNLEDCLGRAANCTNSNDMFDRYVYINFSGQGQNGSDECFSSAFLQTGVSWTDGKCSDASDYCHQVTLDSCVGDIYKTQ